MKYIRTKDGSVIEATTIQPAFILGRGEVVGYIKSSNSALGEIPKDKILKITDTIEDLCDKFIMDTNLTYYTYRHLKDLLLEYDKFQIKDGITIYGAIWTNKGLIYVAKMNEKGDLCLLQQPNVEIVNFV